MVSRPCSAARLTSSNTSDVRASTRWSSGRDTERSTSLGVLRQHRDPHYPDNSVSVEDSVRGSDRPDGASGKTMAPAIVILTVLPRASSILIRTRSPAAHVSVVSVVNARAMAALDIGARQGHAVRSARNPAPMSSTSPRGPPRHPRPLPSDPLVFTTTRSTVGPRQRFRSAATQQQRQDDAKTSYGKDASFDGEGVGRLRRCSPRQ